MVEVPHAATSFPKSMVGLFTTTVTLSVQLTPFVVTVHVYVVVCVGVTLMVGVVAPFDQAKVVCSCVKSCWTSGAVKARL